jgi:hypothetical protein
MPVQRTQWAVAAAAGLLLWLAGLPLAAAEPAAGILPSPSGRGAGGEGAREGDPIIHGPERQTENLAQTGPKPNPAPPRSAEEVRTAVRRGVEFLLARQNANGSWGSERSSRPYEVYAPVPGAHQAFRAAVTALCVSALLEVGGPSPEVSRAVDRGEQFLFEHLKAVRRGSPDSLYNNWTHIYAIDALVHMLHRRPGDAERTRKIRDLIQNQLGMLQRYECVDGGWAYYDFEYRTQQPGGSTLSFMTAAGLVSLAAARAEGIAIPQRLVDRAMASIRRQRNPDFSYDYGEYLKYEPRLPVNRPGGSLGRSQACNLAMRLWGDKEVSDAVMRTWLDRLFARELWLDMGRKRPIPHESWFQVAGYFFYFGHYYAGLCIEQLPAAERGPLRDQLAAVLLPLQEKDGSWWDFPLYDYHQQYGTAFALMSLGHCGEK